MQSTSNSTPAPTTAVPTVIKATRAGEVCPQSMCVVFAFLAALCVFAFYLGS